MGDRILVIDDELSMRELLVILLEQEGYTATAVETAEQALSQLKAQAFDLVLTDLNLPGMDGLALLREVRQIATSAVRDIPFVLVTAYGTTTSAVEAMKQGAADYVLKPFDNDELLLIVKKALNERSLREENLRLKQELQQRHWFGTLIGHSPAMQGVYTLIDRVRNTPINCLITGESGTGKEQVARAIHYSGGRKSGPFVAVNCGAIPENLVESELFGYVKGAFTGAVRDKIGTFAAAHKGTLFLDEIGDMPLSAQVKVLRALEERKVVPVGGVQEQAVDVRILAATHRDLIQEVAAGRFREDLYYRLNVVRIDLPPLRERGEDVLLLAQHFIAHFSGLYEKKLHGLTEAAGQVLLAYGWPGNIRELRNAIERAVALEMDAQIGLSALPQHISAIAKAPRAPAGATPTVSPQAEGPSASSPFVDPSWAALDLPLLDWDGGFDLEALLADLERQLLSRALARTQGNKTQAAKVVGLSFRSFRYRLAKLGMDDEA